MRDFLKVIGLAAAFSVGFFASVYTLAPSKATTQQTVMYVDDVRPAGDATAMSNAHREQAAKRQKTAQAGQQGELRECATPDEIRAQAKAGAKDEYEGTHVLTPAEMQTVIAYVFVNHGVVLQETTIVVVYLKTVAVIFTGTAADAGKVCNFEVMDKEAAKKFFDRVLGAGV